MHHWAGTNRAAWPSQTGYNRLVARYQHVKNIAIMRAGLGRAEGFSTGSGNMSSGMGDISLGSSPGRETAFPIRRRHALWVPGALAGRRLGFWHLDVSYEMHAARSDRPWARDQPMLAVGARAQQPGLRSNWSRLLGMGYKLSMVDEVYGRLDYRNLLAAPRTSRKRG